MKTVHAFRDPCEFAPEACPPPRNVPEWVADIIDEMAQTEEGLAQLEALLTYWEPRVYPQ